VLQASIFASAGVNKIRLTGGEPTLRRDLVELTAALSSLPGVNAVGLTTNGLTLSRKLAALQAAGDVCSVLAVFILLRDLVGVTAPRRGLLGIEAVGLTASGLKRLIALQAAESLV